MYGKAQLTSTAVLPGIRESCRIEGEYVLRIEDYLARRSFPDEIARNSYYLDQHLGADDDRAEKEGPGGFVNYSYDLGESHGIPYRCMLPKSLSNVIVAGRAISCTRIVQSSTRIMPACLSIGEAAGIAAAMAADDGNVRGVDIPALQAKLLQYGAFIRPKRD